MTLVCPLYATLKTFYSLYQIALLLPVLLGRKREEVTGGCCSTLHTDEFHSVYTSPNMIRVIKTRRMRVARHVACMGQKVDIAGLWLLYAKERVQLRDLGVYKINTKEIGWEDTDWIHQVVHMAGL